MASLYLIRHAQSANNAIWNGSSFMPGRFPDPEITPAGHQQAEVLAKQLAHPEGEPRRQPFNQNEQTGFGITQLYCSLMTRSILTAAYIADSCGLALEALPDIHEKFGIYDVDEDGQARGLPGPGRSYFEQRFPGLALPENLNEDGWRNRPIEDEPQFLMRMQKVVVDFRRRLDSSDDSIALIVHGDFIDQFINELMQIPRHEPNYQSLWETNWTMHNTSISRIDFIDGSHNVVYLNRIDHLPAELITW